MLLRIECRPLLLALLALLYPYIDAFIRDNRQRVNNRWGLGHESSPHSSLACSVANFAYNFSDINCGHMLMFLFLSLHRSYCVMIFFLSLFCVHNMAPARLPR